MIENKIKQLLDDNVNQELTYALSRGLYEIISELILDEMYIKDEHIAELETKLDGCMENGAPYQLDTREGISNE